MELLKGLVSHRYLETEFDSCKDVVDAKNLFIWSQGDTARLMKEESIRVC